MGVPRLLVEIRVWFHALLISNSSSFRSENSSRRNPEHLEGFETSHISRLGGQWYQAMLNHKGY